MSYRVRYTFPDGRTGHWMRDYATHEEAQKAIDDRHGDTGLAYTVDEVASPEEKPDPMTTKSYGIRCTGPSGSTFLFRDVYATRCLANEIRDSVERWSGGCFKYTVEEIHDAPEPGSTAAHHVEILRARVKELEEELADAKASLAKAASVPVGASEAPGEGGDSDRRRLEALRAFLDGNEDASLTWWEGEFHAVAEDVAITAPTILALADKLMEKEAKP